MLESFINHGSHWQWLYRCFKPAALKLFLTWFATIPIIYKIFEKVPSEVKLHYFEGVTIVIALPFSWKILWAGSLLYFVGAILYQTFCPGFIKRFPDYSAFCNQGHSPRFLVWEFSRTWKFGDWKDSLWESAQVKGLVTQIDSDEEKEKIQSELGTKISAGPIVEGGATVLYILKSNIDKSGKKTDQFFKASLGDASDRKAQQKNREIFWEIFGAHAKEFPVIRWIIWALLALSYFCILIVIIQKILFVLTKIV